MDLTGKRFRPFLSIAHLFYDSKPAAFHKGIPQRTTFAHSDSIMTPNSAQGLLSAQLHKQCYLPFSEVCCITNCVHTADVDVDFLYEVLKVLLSAGMTWFWNNPYIDLAVLIGKVLYKHWCNFGYLTRKWTMWDKKHIKSPTSPLTASTGKHRKEIMSSAAGLPLSQAPLFYRLWEIPNYTLWKTGSECCQWNSTESHP